MSTPILISCLIGILVALLLGGWPRHRPNVVLVVVDTLRADAISTALGTVESPNIARLAAEGIAFPQAYAQAPMTVPAHTSLFSGMYPWETGVLGNGQDVPSEIPLLAEYLTEHDYQTLAVVSLATMWPRERHHGLDRGFQLYDQGRFEAAPAEDTSERLSLALDQLDADQPFFLFAHFSDPHEPYNDHGASGRAAEVRVDGERVDVITTSQMTYWEADLELTAGTHELVIESGFPFRVRSLQCTEGGRSIPFQFLEGELQSGTERARISVPGPAHRNWTASVRVWVSDIPSTSEIHQRYAREVAAADTAIGKLFAELKERGLWEDTLVIVTGDHGEALGEHEVVGHVVNLYDEMLHVPLVIRLPEGVLDERLEVTGHELVRHVDVLPTVLDLLNLPSIHGISGRSLLESGNRIVLAETHPPEAPRTLFCLRDETYKLIYSAEDNSYEMFRLGPDPMELDNVFSHQGHLRKAWQVMLEKLAGRTVPTEEADEVVTGRLSALGY